MKKIEKYKQSKRKRHFANKTDGLKWKYILVLTFIFDMLIFVVTDIIGYFGHRIGPPAIIILILFYFIYKRKNLAYIGYYLVATLGFLLGIISGIMILATPSSSHTLFGCARFISALAYVVTAIIISLYQKNLQ